MTQKYKFTIHQPTTGHHTYVVPEAESFQDAVRQIEEDNADTFVTEQFVFDDTLDYVEVYRSPVALVLDLGEFLAARKFTPAHHTGDTDVPEPALVYPGGLYIQITNGGYMLVLGNSNYLKGLTDVRGLQVLEELLYRWGVSEGVFCEPSH